MIKNMLFVILFNSWFLLVGQTTQYHAFYDYKNVNTQSFIPMMGWSNEQKHLLSILKHSFEMQQIVSNSKDTSFVWNGLAGKKTIYTKDSLILFFVRPDDTITRPCILVTHGNDAAYRSDWHDQTKFIVIDLVMRGFCVIYYENPSSKEAKQIRANNHNNQDSTLLNVKNDFYNGFQSAVAANIYAKHNVRFLYIDTTKMFAGGYSYGAFCSLSLATADVGKNFIDSIFNTQGNFIAKSIYTDNYTKNIKGVFSIGGALPKDDTLPIYNSKMGTFLDEQDSVSLLFLHGRTDNFVYFDLTKMYETTNSSNYFFIEGPNAIRNIINEKSLHIKNSLVVNCKGGHNFSTSVCNYNNPYCMAQWHWLYLSEPDSLSLQNNSYFTNLSNDTMLHYVAYMLTQVSDVGYMISDFFQPITTTNAATLDKDLYYVEPHNQYGYFNANGYYIYRTTDCEGNPIQLPTAVAENIIKNEDVFLYPNPTSNLFTIIANKTIAKVIIYNMLGEIIKIIVVNNMQTQIDIHDFVKGEYIVATQLKDKLITKKLSKI